MHREITIPILIAASLSVPVFSQEKSQIREEIEVIGTRIPTEFSTLSRTVTILDGKSIEKIPASSVAELLKYILSVDLRQRAPFGIQADLSLRGSDYSQVLIMIDGVKVIDPQTAHHNLDLPVSLADVERIEVLHGQGSATYGENAVGGVVNIITKAAHEQAMSLFLTGGQHRTLGAGLSLTFPLRAVSQALSFEVQDSEGFAYDRGFHSLNFTSRTRYGDDKIRLNVLAGYNRKSFGANGFYAAFPSKEWTETRFLSLNGEIERMDVRIFTRWHKDRFRLDIERPDLFNSLHRTLSTGAEASTRIRIPSAGTLVLGGEIKDDRITSQTLGDHDYRKLGFFAEIQTLWLQKWQVQAGLRGDFFSNFGSEMSPSLSVSYLISPRFKFRTSVGQAFRIPSFTELYYSSPANQGNPDLKPERSFSMEAGLDVFPSEGLTFEVSLFWRRDRNLIDWIRESDKSPWRAANIQVVEFRGIETRVTGSRLSLGYTFLSSQLDQPQTFVSKYALRHPIHQLSGGWTPALPYGLDLGLFGSFKKRKNEDTYLVLDAKISKMFKGMDFFVKVTNLLNADYEDIPGVQMPGRWLMAGFAFDR